MATNMQNKLEYSSLLYCNTIDYNQKVLCNAREVEFNIKTVKPERTFLEKIFLLHEEWQKKDVRVNRLGRHLYDLHQLMSTKYSDIAMINRELYFTIIDHRRKFNTIKGVNYDHHWPKYIKIIPPESVLNDYQIDYENMKENMITGEKPSWNELVNNLLHLQDQIRALDW